MKAIIEKYGAKFGHRIVATVRDELELNSIIRKVDATVFLFDPEFPRLFDGRSAAITVQYLRPKMKIVTITGADESVTFGNVNLPAPVSAQELIGVLNDL
jgi:hypothetical protein